MSLPIRTAGRRVQQFGDPRPLEDHHRQAACGEGIEQVAQDRDVEPVESDGLLAHPGQPLRARLGHALGVAEAKGAPGQSVVRLGRREDGRPCGRAGAERADRLADSGRAVSSSSPSTCGSSGRAAR